MSAAASSKAQVADFDDASRWEVVRGVAVFDEHTDRRGDKVVRKFTRKDLEDIAERCNDRDAVGQPCPLTIGHTRDDAPEHEQPEFVGYARKFRVAYDSRLKRHVVRADYYLRKDRASEAREYPRISVEYWPDGKFFDPIALLRRTPQRDLGQWTYHRRAPGGAACIRYGMGENAMADYRDDEDKPKGPAAPPDKDEPSGEERDEGEARRDDDEPDGDEVDPEFHDKFARCMAKHYPKLMEMHKRYADERPGASEDGPERNARRPAAAEPVSPAHHVAKPAARDASRLGDVVRLAKVEAENKALKLKFDAMERKEADAARRDVLMKLKYELGYKIDPDSVLKMCRRMSDSEFADQVDFIRETAQKDPASGPDFQVARESPSAKYARAASEGDPEQFTDADLARADEYLVKNPNADWESARKYAMENRPKRFGALKESRS